MDTDAPQGDAPVIPTEEPDEDVSVLMPPTQSVQQPPTEVVVPAPEPDDADPAINSTSDDPALSSPPSQPEMPQVPPQTVTTEPPDNDGGVVSADMPTTEAASSPISTPNLEVVENPVTHPTAPPRSRSDMKILAGLALAKRLGNKAAKLERIIALAQKKGHFTVRDVELHLLLPKRTAEEYLDELVTDGRLSRRGNVGSTEYWWVG